MKNPKLINTRNNLLKLLGKQNKVAEIGVFKGEFSKEIIFFCQPEELHLIDIFEGSMCSGDKDGNNIIWTDLTNEYNNLKEIYKFNSNVTLHKGKSNEILKKFDDAYFDFIYIDGDHSYAGVKQDLNMSMQKIKPNGLICGHDYTIKYFPGVVQAVDEFCKTQNLQINYLTQDNCPSYCIVKG
jgi:hypothetical protein